MRRALVVLFGCVVGFGGSAIAVAAGPAADDPLTESHFTKTGGYCADAEEREFLDLINDYRQSKGLGPLKLTQTLGGASDHHSKSMAQHNYFSHDLKAEGITWSQNISRHGYKYNTYKGENIAAGNAAASATFTQWKNSSGHNANMLSDKFKAIGIGRAYDAQSKYGWYWTTDFGGYVDAAAKTC
jgi:uncharacterized protein YkwD